MPGVRVIFWLFVALAAATAAGLTLFVFTDAGWPYRRTVFIAMAVDLSMPVVAWFIMKAITKRRAAAS